jgi:hypothetical protein
VGSDRSRHRQDPQSVNGVSHELAPLLPSSVLGSRSRRGTAFLS